jgi:5-methylcytosine-specific restriction protein A
VPDIGLTLPSRPCPRNCGRVTNGSGACSVCREAQDRARGHAHARGYTSRWTTHSARLRRTALRWCGDRMPSYPRTEDSHCPAAGLGRVPSEVVDHIIPIEGPNDRLLWEPSNWQGLCHHCHNRKRQRERTAAGRRRE